MTALSLFSGADGFGLAASLLGIEVLAHVEIDTVFDEHYKRHWPYAKRFYDVRTTSPGDLPSTDIVFGGEPCQGNSSAGNRKGKEDDRYLWPDYFAICKAKRPTWIINENVTGSISNMVLDTKIADLESIGYSCRAFNLPAVAVGAFNERKRIWLVAYTDGQRSFQGTPSFKRGWTLRRTVQQEELQGEGLGTQYSRGVTGRIFPYPDERVFEMVNDVPSELAQLKAYGNAVNPWIPFVLLSFIKQVHES